MSKALCFALGMGIAGCAPEIIVVALGGDHSPPPVVEVELSPGVPEYMGPERDEEELCGLPCSSQFDCLVAGLVAPTPCEEWSCPSFGTCAGTCVVVDVAKGGGCQVRGVQGTCVSKGGRCKLPPPRPPPRSEEESSPDLW